MTGIILHHYWPSPVAEKVRVVLGLKRLSWQSVEIPRVPPKPDVIALTGGYRRTPVMQLDADIYCDSQCIIRELERRFNNNSLMSTSASDLLWGIGRWTDGELFTHAIRIVLGSQMESLDPNFLSDRARLYFGENWTKESIVGGVQQSIGQIETAFNWMNTSLTKNGRFIISDVPTLADAFCYYICWFIRGRYHSGPALINKFAQLAQWEKRVADRGHGNHSELESSAAINIACASRSAIKLNNFQGTGVESSLLHKLVRVKPSGGEGDPYVEGKLVGLTHDEIVVSRTDKRAGDVRVHFPAMGYELSSQESVR